MQEVPRPFATACVPPVSSWFVSRLSFGNRFLVCLLSKSFSLRFAARFTPLDKPLRRVRLTNRKRISLAETGHSWPAGLGISAFLQAHRRPGLQRRAKGALSEAAGRVPHSLGRLT